MQTGPVTTPVMGLSMGTCSAVMEQIIEQEARLSNNHTHYI